LTALIGADAIHDEPPRAKGGVYLVHGEAKARDWSTSSDRGSELRLSLVVWAGETSSARLALEVAAAVAARLDGAPLVLAGHRLVALAYLGSQLARDAATRLPTVTLEFRAVTEAL
jgi:hypothetical protein